LLRLINLLALLAAVAWLSKQPDWEPFITTLGLFVTLLGQELPRTKQNRIRDKALFEQFKSTFPSNGRSAKFLRDHDIGGSFHPEVLNELDAFLFGWDNSEHEFIDSDLEAARKVLHINGRDFRGELSIEVSMSHAGMLTMGMHDFELRKEMLDKRDELNRLASRVYKAHQNLMKLGKHFE